MSKTKITVIGLAIISLVGVVSCNKASKAKPIIEKAYKEYKAASETDAAKYLKTRHRCKQAQRIYNEMTTSPCSTCNGRGVVYMVNEYGYAITDCYGNYQFQYCPNCGGTGKR